LLSEEQIGWPDGSLAVIKAQLHFEPGLYFFAAPGQPFSIVSATAHLCSKWEGLAVACTLWFGSRTSEDD